MNKTWKRVNNKWSKFEISKGKKHSQKNWPQKVGPLYWVPPLLISWEGELTLFSTPLLITSRHYIQVEMSHEFQVTYITPCGPPSLNTPKDQGSRYCESWLHQKKNRRHRIPWNFFRRQVQLPEISRLGPARCLGGGNSNIFYLHPENWGKMNPIWLIFFRWVETTNKVCKLNKWLSQQIIATIPCRLLTPKICDKIAIMRYIGGFPKKKRCKSG